MPCAQKAMLFLPKENDRKSQITETMSIERLDFDEDEEEFNL